MIFIFDLEIFGHQEIAILKKHFGEFKFFNCIYSDFFHENSKYINLFKVECHEEKLYLLLCLVSDTSALSL